MLLKIYRLVVPYAVLVTGAITDDTIEAIKNALKYNNTAKIELDLSETTELTTIRNMAFEFCMSLTSMSIPTSVTEIENSAFVLCSNLKNITIPSSVMKIGQDAFYSCDSLTSVTFAALVIGI